ncbi:MULTISPECIES: hypothetical protein [Sphingobium]|uniref:hypothetical protein n=1 Tax=Sphingobium TaxID=165695 RepID=UPI0013754C4B
MITGGHRFGAYHCCALEKVLFQDPARDEAASAYLLAQDLEAPKNPDEEMSTQPHRLSRPGTAKDVPAEPRAQVLGDAKAIAPLPPGSRAMINPYRLPEVIGRRKAGEEYPTRGFCIETGVMF